jgi:hypothetical protein
LNSGLSYLLGRHSTTWTTPSALYLSCFALPVLDGWLCILRFFFFGGFLPFCLFSQYYPRMCLPSEVTFLSSMWQSCKSDTL